jgi:hypothetical protein
MTLTTIDLSKETKEAEVIPERLWIKKYFLSIRKLSIEGRKDRKESMVHPLNCQMRPLNLVVVIFAPC